MTISILGCGWLGFPLAKMLLAAGHTVKGSTTSLDKLPMLREAGIEPFCLNLAPEPQGVSWSSFLQTDLLIVNIPPRLERAGAGFHVAQMAALVRLLGTSPVRRVVQVSSTSVYPELNREMTEEDVTTPAQSAAPTLVAAEQIVQSLPVPSLVLRCGGLMGYERIPGKYVSGKKNLETGDVPVNYVHRDDVVRVIGHFAENQPHQNGVFNVVAPLHPTRRQIYQATCPPFGYEMPTFVQPAVAVPFKTVSSQKLINKANFLFKYPNPVLFNYSKTENQ